MGAQVPNGCHEAHSHHPAVQNLNPSASESGAQPTLRLPVAGSGLVASMISGFFLLVPGALQIHGDSVTERWSFTTPKPILASPTIGSDGHVYVGSYDRKIYALNAGGKLLWVTSLPTPEYIYSGDYAGILGTPAVGP